MPPKSKRFEEKTNKLRRLLSILRKIDNRERCTPQTLSEKFDTTERNIYRDMNDLDAAGFPILFDKEFNGYRFADPEYQLRELGLTSDELMALLISHQVARSIGKPFEKAFQAILKKVHTDTSRETQAKARRMEGEKRFFVGIDHDEEWFKKVEKQYNAINEAIDRKVELEIAYKKLKDEKETGRTIAPYGLVFQYGLWYVVGYCNLRKDIRVFALDCIKDFKLTERHYSIPADFNIGEYFKPGWKMRRYGKPVEVVLRFGKEYAAWIKRRKWHPTQKIEERKDGSIIFRVTVEGTKELKWWIYHWIPFCKVLAPPELRKEMTDEMKAMLKVYGKEHER
ncbi:MAG: transcriptional regulator [Deltaproteobacteria bacterium]|nr:transcriptional regulator [Deltaproteobacteria bacterium]